MLEKYLKDVLISLEKETDLTRRFFLHREAFLELLNQNAHRAYEQLDEAKKIAYSLGNSELIHIYKLNLGRYYTRTGRYTDARKAFQEAIQYFRSVDDYRNLAIALEGIAGVEILDDKFRQALNYCLEALTFYRKAECKPSFYAMCLNAAGSCYENLSKYDEAENYYLMALDALKNIEHGRFHAIVYGNLGLLMLRQERINEAIAHFIKAMHIFNLAYHEYGKGLTAMHLGKCYAKLDEHAKALGFFRLSIRSFRQGGFKKEEADVHLCLGKFFKMIGGFESAMEHLQKALEIYRNKAQVDQPEKEALQLLSECRQMIRKRDNADVPDHKASKPLVQNNDLSS